MESCIVLDIKLWGNFDRLKLILNRDYDEILIQTDNLKVVSLIQDDFLKVFDFTLTRKFY